MKIVKLSAENFKRLRAVEITPEGHLVEIRGKNAAGKSSVLDAIMCAIAGGRVLPTKPIRRGEETARIEVDLGELVVTRRFTASDSTVIVETQTGARHRSPQRMLDELIGQIAFDPLEFTRMNPKEQLNTLREMIKPEVDIDALDLANQRDYDKRTEFNRDAKKLRAQASGIQFPVDLPANPIDIGMLTADLRQAGEVNTKLEREKAQRDRIAEAANASRNRAAALYRQVVALTKQAQEQESEANRHHETLSNFRPLDQPIDTEPLIKEMDRARTVNAHLQEKARRETLEAEAAALEMRSEALTDLMSERSDRKARAIAESAMPIPGLSFGDGEVLYDGVPLDQASQAEKIRISVAIAMAANPTLRVLCVRDGSLLDRDSWRLLSDLVKSQDYQCWVEVTDDDGKTGIVIEDGAVRGAHPALPIAGE